MAIMKALAIGIACAALLGGCGQGGNPTNNAPASGAQQGKSTNNTAASAPQQGNPASNTAASGPQEGKTTNNTAASGPQQGNSASDTAASSPQQGNRASNAAASGPEHGKPTNDTATFGGGGTPQSGQKTGSGANPQKVAHNQNSNKGKEQYTGKRIFSDYRGQRCHVIHRRGHLVRICRAL